jgi:hypothetical protein
MNYIITGRDTAGLVSLKRDSAAGAVKKAIELLAEGVSEVHITDPSGRLYSQAEFAELSAAART